LQVRAVSATASYATTTERWGPFQLVLPPGDYQVWVERAGEAVSPRSAVRIEPGVDVKLQLVAEFQEFEHIDGRAQPDRVPPEVLWENLFTVVADVLEDTAGEARERRLRALAVYNLEVSVEDVRVLAEVALATRAKVATLREPLEREHRGETTLPWTPAQYTERHAEVASAFLEAGAALRKRLPPAAFAQIEKYLVEKIAPGTQIVRRVPAG